MCERQRLLHEEIEFLEKSMREELLKNHLSHKDKINSDHRVRRMMDVCLCYGNTESLENLGQKPAAP